MHTYTHTHYNNIIMYYLVRTQCHIMCTQFSWIDSILDRLASGEELHSKDPKLTM